MQITKGKDTLSKVQRKPGASLEESSPKRVVWDTLSYPSNEL